MVGSSSEPSITPKRFFLSQMSFHLEFPIIIVSLDQFGKRE